jgi:hypothetical protein
MYAFFPLSFIIRSPDLPVKWSTGSSSHGRFRQENEKQKRNPNDKHFSAYLFYEAPIGWKVGKGGGTK